MSELVKKSLGADLRKDKIGLAFGSFGFNLGSAVLMTYLRNR